MAKLIRFDGGEDNVFPADPSTGFTLQECYTLIGCEIVEVVYLENGQLMIVDENGKLRNDWIERINPVATQLFYAGRAITDDLITGNALICDDKEFQ
jgi:hypothetical protein